MEFYYSFYDKPEIMKIFWAWTFKHEPTLKAMIAHWKWRVANLPIKPTNKAIELIVSFSIFYIKIGKRLCDGIWTRLPVQALHNNGFWNFVTGSCKFHNLSQKNKTVDVRAMAHALMLTQEYVIKNMFLDGQIENWVCIVDMAGTGLTSVPKAELQGIAEILGKNYLGRLGRAWLVNTSWMTKILWVIVSSFLEKRQIEKIHLTDKNVHPDMIQYFQPGHLLKRFGGEGEAPSSWPPYVPPSQCWKEESNLLSEEEYLKVLEIRPLLQKRPDLIKKEEA